MVTRILEGQKYFTAYVFGINLPTHLISVLTTKNEWILTHPVVLGGNVHFRWKFRLGDAGAKTALDALHADLPETGVVLHVFGARRKLARPLAAQPSFQQDHSVHGLPSKRSFLLRHVHSEVHAVRWSHRGPDRHQDDRSDVNKTILGGEYCLWWCANSR